MDWGTESELKNFVGTIRIISVVSLFICSLSFAIQAFTSEIHDWVNIFIKLRKVARFVQLVVVWGADHIPSSDRHDRRTLKPVKQTLFLASPWLSFSLYVVCCRVEVTCAENCKLLCTYKNKIFNFFNFTLLIVDLKVKGVPVSENTFLLPSEYCTKNV